MSTATNGRAREHRVMKRMTDAGWLDDIILAHVTRSAEERFWRKVRAVGGPLDCWEWIACTAGGGYGKFFVTKINGRTILARAHRWSFLVLRSEDITGLVLDHRCRNTACVNPWHLEPVTLAENVSRQISWNGNKTHCKRNHELSGDNLGFQNGGHRYCRTCKRLTDSRVWRSAA